MNGFRETVSLRDGQTDGHESLWSPYGLLRRETKKNSFLTLFKRIKGIRGDLEFENCQFGPKWPILDSFWPK